MSEFGKSPELNTVQISFGSSSRRSKPKRLLEDEDERMVKQRSLRSGEAAPWRDPEPAGEKPLSASILQRPGEFQRSEGGGG